jgi:hypothetical protein
LTSVSPVLCDSIITYWHSQETLNKGNQFVVIYLLEQLLFVSVGFNLSFSASYIITMNKLLESGARIKGCSSKPKQPVEAGNSEHEQLKKTKHWKIN